MMNLLGRDLDLLEDQFAEHPEWHVHIYGKTNVNLIVRWDI